MSVAVEVAGGGGGHVIYLLPFLLLESTFSTSLPPTSLPTATLGGAILATPTLLFSSPALSLSLSLFALLRRPSRTLSRYIHLSVPVCLLLSPLRGLSLTWNNSPSFFLYLSLSLSLPLAPRPSLCFSRFPPPFHPRLVPSPRTASRNPPSPRRLRQQPFPLRLKLRAWNSWQLFGTARRSPFLRSIAPGTTRYLTFFVHLSLCFIHASFPSPRRHR